MKAPLPENEAARLAALRRYDVLDTLPEEAFERAARLAARILGTEVGLVSLVDEMRQWFKAHYGWSVAETSRDLSFCAHAILGEEVFVVPDAMADVRFADNALVTGDPKIRFYAGAPLKTSDGFSLGTLCAVDSAPRPQVSKEDLDALADLAASVTTELELRLAMTQLQRSQAALRASETRFRTLIENSFDIVTVLGPDGRIRYQSPSIHRLLGYDPDELVGQSAFDLVHPDDVSAVRAAFAVMVERGEEREVEFRFLNKAGQWRVLAAVGGAGAGPAADEVIVNSRDVTARREVESALRESEARQSAIMQSALDAILAIDHEGKIHDWNAAAKTLFGWTREEVLGCKLRDTIFPLRLRAAAPAAELERYLATGEGRILEQRFEITAVRKSGVEFPVELAITRIGLEGTPMFTGFVRDITAIKEIESERTRLFESERVARRSAEEANKAKSQFLANMSHELRTPLNSVIGFSDMLKLQAFGELNERQLGYVEHIRNAGSHLLGLISDVLDLAKVEAGKMTLDFQEVDVETMLHDSAAALRPMAAAKNISLECTFATDLPKISADGSKLRQIIFNLLSNAIKFTPQDGAITLRASPEDDGEFLRLCVVDNGIGIPLEDQARVFREFEQIDNSYARAQEGTGLGLALTKRLIEAHGGTIAVESSGISGEGSSFIVRLPRTQPAGAEQMEEMEC